MNIMLISGPLFHQLGSWAQTFTDSVKVNNN